MQICDVLVAVAFVVAKAPYRPMTVSRDLVNHKKIFVVQNRCQKWKERDEISKDVNFEATDIYVRDFTAILMLKI